MALGEERADRRAGLRGGEYMMGWVIAGKERYIGIYAIAVESVLCR